MITINEIDPTPGLITTIITGPSDEAICAAADIIRASAHKPLAERPALLHVERRGRELKIAIVGCTDDRQLDLLEQAA